jgi:hypothetical protein
VKLGMPADVFERKMAQYVVKYFQTEQYYKPEDAASLSAKIDSSLNAALTDSPCV